MNRTPYEWDVTLQREDGEVIDFPFTAYWDPTKDDDFVTPESIGNAAQAMAYVQGGKQYRYKPVGVQLITGTVPVPSED